MCGSGGKSSLCLALAKETQEAGKRAAITTTTHIGTPCDPDTAVFVSENVLELREIIKSGRIPIAGKREGSKLCFGGIDQFGLLLSETDTLYVEADGSKMLPLKYPNSSEPVLPIQSDAIVTVCGLSALGRPLSEVCHRMPLACAAIPDLNSVADVDSIAAILWEGYNRYDPVYVLNQADSEEQIKAGMMIKERLEQYGAHIVAMVSLRRMGLADKRFF